MTPSLECEQEPLYLSQKCWTMRLKKLPLQLVSDIDDNEEEEPVSNYKTDKTGIRKVVSSRLSISIT